MRAPHYGPARRALVLAGGGITGGLYEIGALIALDSLFDDFRVRDFDTFVGTSAGALVAALVANGVAPLHIRDTLENDRRTLPRLSGARFLSIPWAHHLGTIPRIAAALPGIAHDLWANWKDVLVFDTLASLTRHLPHGLFCLDGLEAYVRQVLTSNGRSDEFATLPSRLLIPATVLDTGSIHVFGGSRGERTPISRAVAASAAVPLLFEPVCIDGVDYIDGAVTKTAHASLATERGAQLVIVVNPIRPLVFERPGTVMREGGALAIAGQAMRIALNRRLREGLGRHRYEHPEADVVLLEPYEADLELFDLPLMTYTLRQEVIRRGYRTTVKTILNDFERFKALFGRHGIAMAPRRDIERRARKWSSAARKVA
ncbi:MAG TPA: patatin-like phospholipase family protein [Candidatus Binatia bacterium]|jgi:predicted acylesterase/phospholipase RssA|nr:patatin-like phospholipase family protein [Candidatus Binatia bacterium]